MPPLYMMCKIIKNQYSSTMFLSVCLSHSRFLALLSLSFFSFFPSHYISSPFLSTIFFHLYFSVKPFIQERCYHKIYNIQTFVYCSLGVLNNLRAKQKFFFSQSAFSQKTPRRFIYRTLHSLDCNMNL